MGYLMRAMAAEVHIPRARFDEALAAIKAIPPAFPDGRWSFVSGERVRAAATLDEALRAWRWVPEYDDAGNITALLFDTGDDLYDKLGDDRLLLMALAPFVQPGGEIVMIGSDDEIWRWRFDGQHVHEENGHLTFSPGDKLVPPWEAPTTVEGGSA